jgi:hypothetical protein
MHTFTFFMSILKQYSYVEEMHFEVSQPLKNHHEQVDSMFLFNKMCIRPSPNMLMAPKSFCWLIMDEETLLTPERRWV